MNLVSMSLSEWKVVPPKHLACRFFIMRGRFFIVRSRFFIMWCRFLIMWRLLIMWFRIPKP